MISLLFIQPVEYIEGYQVRKKNIYNRNNKKKSTRNDLL
jgi:hypothetical protein